MGETGKVDAVRVCACLVAVGAHLGLWLVFRHAARVPAPVAGTRDALQVTWIEPPPPAPASAPAATGPAAAPAAMPQRVHRPATPAAAAVAQATAPPARAAMSAVFIEQGRRLAAPAPDADAFRADPLAHRAAKLPGVQADTFRMRTPMSTQRVLRAIGGLVAGPGYTTDPCPRVADNIRRMSQDGDNALLQEELRRKRALCD